MGLRLRRYDLEELPYPYTASYVSSSGVPETTIAFLRVYFYLPTAEEKQSPLKLKNPRSMLSRDNERIIFQVCPPPTLILFPNSLNIF